jgi:thermostable 8-oxoguanine DNA glycosylase
VRLVTPFGSSKANFLLDLTGRPQPNKKARNAKTQQCVQSHEPVALILGLVHATIFSWHSLCIQAANKNMDAQFRAAGELSLALGHCTRAVARKDLAVLTKHVSDIYTYM